MTQAETSLLARMEVPPPVVTAALRPAVEAVNVDPVSSDVAASPEQDRGDASSALASE